MEEKTYPMRADTPLKAIACFDAVMRTGSATVAAQDLDVTPGAVAQQIRKLEAWLKVSLFIRSIRKLTPTDEALRYWAQVKPALQQLEIANDSVRNSAEPIVRLSLPPAFASLWFTRRMPLLTERFPHLRLLLSSSARAVALRSGAFDFAVRHFDGKTEDHLHVQLLLRDDARVYCSPHYRRRITVQNKVMFSSATLLNTTSHANWSGWLARAGLSSSGPASSLWFDQSELAIEAARQHQGLVLTSPWLVEDDVRRGLLVQLFPTTFDTDKGYYLVRDKDRQLSDAAAQLWQWLAETASSSRRKSS